MIIRLRHALAVEGFSRRRGFCIPGIRRWCRAHEIDYGDFVRHGIEEERLRAINDALANAVIRQAHRLAGEEAGRG